MQIQIRIQMFLERAGGISSLFVPSLRGNKRGPKLYNRLDGARMAEACARPKGTPQDVGDTEDGMKKSDHDFPD